MNAFTVLGLPADATETEIRAAYLRAIKEHPPETSPEQFEKIRDAYEELRDPRKRARESLAIDPDMPVVTLLSDGAKERRFLGPELWIAALKGQAKHG